MTKKQDELRILSTERTEKMIGADNEVTRDRDRKTLVYHDGKTRGGFPIGRVSEIVQVVEDLAALKALGSVPGKLKDGYRFTLYRPGYGQLTARWDASSTATANDLNVIAADGVTTGRFIIDDLRQVPDLTARDAIDTDFIDSGYVVYVIDEGEYKWDGSEWVRQNGYLLQTVDTMAELRAMTGLEDGQQVQVLGSGAFYYDAELSEWVPSKGTLRLSTTSWPLPPGDYTSDNTDVVAYLEYCADKQLTAYFGPGEWVWNGTLTVNVPSGKRLSIEGYGESLTTIKRGARNLDSGRPRLLSAVSGSSDSELSIENLTFDGNARENPLLLNVDSSSVFVVGETITGGTSGTTATILVIESGIIGVDFRTGVFESGETVTGSLSGTTATTTSSLSFAEKEQSDCLGTIGDFRYVSIFKTTFKDPTADGWNSRSGRKKFVTITSVTETGRTRFRNCITQNGSIDNLVVDGLVDARISFETAGSAAHENTVEIKNSRFSINLAFSSSLGYEKNKFHCHNSVVRGMAGGGDWDCLFESCTFHLSSWRPTGQGDLKFYNCDFYMEEEGQGIFWSDLGTSMIASATDPHPGIMHFVDCTFHPLPASAGNLDQYLGFGKDPHVKEIKVKSCRFMDPGIAAIATRFGGSRADIEFSDNDFHFNPVDNSPNIRWQREFFPSSIEDQNTYRVYNNKVHSANATVIKIAMFHTDVGAVPIFYDFGGNKRVTDGSASLYQFTDFSHLVAPHGSGDRIKIGHLDNVWGDDVPTDGNWIQGQRVYRRVPVAGGSEGWVCVESGTPGTWKEFGSVVA